MKVFKVMILSLMVLGLVFSAAFAMKHLPEERGKTLFNDPKFAGGTNACSTCHPDGSGLEKAAAKYMGKTEKGLEDVVNACIEMGNKGKAIDKKSEQMKDIVAYIKSLGKKTPGY